MTQNDISAKHGTAHLTDVCHIKEHKYCKYMDIDCDCLCHRQISKNASPETEDSNLLHVARILRKIPNLSRSKCQGLTVSLFKNNGFPVREGYLSAMCATLEHLKTKDDSWDDEVFMTIFKSQVSAQMLDIYEERRKV